jgi:hypothetical protein
VRARAAGLACLVAGVGSAASAPSAGAGCSADPVAPYRLLDTRAGVLGGPARRLAEGETLRVPVTLGWTVGRVAQLNVTVVDPSDEWSTCSGASASALSASSRAAYREMSPAAVIATGRLWCARPAVSLAVGLSGGWSPVARRPGIGAVLGERLA